MKEKIDLSALFKSDEDAKKLAEEIINKINEQDCRYTSLFKNIDKNSIIKNTIIFSLLFK